MSIGKFCFSCAVARVIIFYSLPYSNISSLIFSPPVTLIFLLAHLLHLYSCSFFLTV